MQDLSKLFTDLFDDPKITNNRLVTCGEDQNKRLNDNNPGGIYDDISDETKTRVGALKSIIVARSSDEGTRGGSTTIKDTAQDNLTKYISQQEGLVKSKFGKNSGQYKEFFPQGLSVFHTGTEEEYDNNTKVVTEKALKYETELGIAFKTEVTALYGLWHTAYTNQGDDTVTADNDSTEEKAAAKALKLQLTKNALFIAYNNVGNEAAYNTYFDTSLLFPQHRTHIYKGLAAVNSTSPVHAIEYSAGKKFHMKNKGAVELGFRMWLGDTPVGNTFSLQPGEELDKSFTDFFSNGDSLRVTNSSLETEGAYEVREVA